MDKYGGLGNNYLRWSVLKGFYLRYNRNKQLNLTTMKKYINKTQAEKFIVKYVKILRRIPNPQDEYYVHENQLDAIKEIIVHYLMGVKYVMLYSETQAGKTGVMYGLLYVINSCTELKNKLKLDNYFTTIPISDNDLYEQHQKDAGMFTGISDIDKNVLKIQDMNKLSKNGQLNATNTNIHTKLEKGNFLLLHDESDRASNKEQTTDNFTKRFGLSVNGKKVDLNNENNFILSISATQMAEASERKHTKKAKVILNTVAGYYGIRDMFKTHKIKQSFNLKSKPAIDNFLEISSTYKNKYIIVRSHSEKKQTPLINAIKKRKSDFEYKHYNMLSKKDDINQILINEPPITTFVFIKGMLRAGKRIKHKKNIGMVHDTYKSNTDVTAQSLLGRMTGYNVNKNIDIYCDIDSAERHRDWVSGGFDDDKIPNKSRNIIGKNEYTNKFMMKCYIDNCAKFPQFLSLLKGYDTNKSTKSKKDKLYICQFLSNAFKHGNKYVKIEPKDGRARFEAILSNESSIHFGTFHKLKESTSYDNKQKLYTEPRYGNTIFSDKPYKFTEKTLQPGYDIGDLRPGYNIGEYIIESIYLIEKNAFLISVGKIVKTLTKSNENSIYLADKNAVYLYP